MYYDDGKIRVRNSVKADIDLLAPKLRESDIQEIWASNNATAYEALKEGIEKSIFCATVENGSPIAMFGIYADNLLGEKGNVWLLASEDLTKIQIKFLRQSKKFIKLMLEYYKMLENYVDCRNEKSIQWLRFCGAKFDEPKPYGVENKMFMRFQFDRSK